MSKALPTTPNWWWTVSRPGSSCSACGERCGAQLVAYDSHAKSVLCELCADRWGIASVCKDSRRSRNWRRGARG